MLINYPYTQKEKRKAFHTARRGLVQKFKAAGAATLEIFAPVCRNIADFDVISSGRVSFLLLVCIDCIVFEISRRLT